MFAVLRIFFFPNYLNSNFKDDKSKANHVRQELIERRKWDFRAKNQDKRQKTKDKRLKIKDKRLKTKEPRTKSKEQRQKTKD